MSFDAPASPRVKLKALAKPRRGPSYGWGFAWFPDQSASALVVKDATSSGDNAMAKLLREWDRFQSTLFVCHLRGAARALQEQDTHPFSKSYGGRDWILAHNGDLEAPAGKSLAEALSLGDDPVFEPVGRSDSEWALCWILQQSRAIHARSIAEIGWARLHDWFRTLDGLGTANFVVTDGRDLAVYRDEEGYNELSWARLLPPSVPECLEAEDLEVDFVDIRDRSRTAVVFSTKALGDGFAPMQHGQLMGVRRGAVVYDSHGTGRADRTRVPPRAHAPERGPVSFGSEIAQAGLQIAATQSHEEGSVREPEPATYIAPVMASAPTQTQAQYSSPPEEFPVPGQPAPFPLPLKPSALHHHAQLDGAGRVMSVEHRTVYRYQVPVERSTHLFRLKPCHDRWQDLLHHELFISVDGAERAYQDVFDNHVTRVEIEDPFTELVVVARSLVQVRGEVPEDLHSPMRRFTIPLVWMPWQRQMMLPYLLPPELPETQLQELTEFAMSFVERQDYDLVQTLIDMNTTLFRDFKYLSGSTTLKTTPFDVFVARKGVCQDFANLLICMARLLGVPARYRVGYIHTGADYENKQQADASHAWAELYLPWTGWQGFDPTNGRLVGMDHVRVAAGRNYGDATPTSGTIYKGGAGERLEVSVKVEIIQEAP